MRLDLFVESHLHDPVYLQWMQDYQVVRTLNLPSYWERVDFATVRKYVHGLLNAPNDRLFALIDTLDGAFVGTMKAGHVDWQSGVADIGIMIGARDRWGQGLARDGIRALSGWLFHACGLRRLTSGFMAINPAMESPFTRNGFRREGILRHHDRLREGGYCDHILMGCFADEFSQATSGKGRSE